jgi:putative glutamine amidotransferase
MKDSENQIFLVRSYMQVLLQAGGIPILLSPDMDVQSMEACLGQLDGLMLAGGCDVVPAHFGETPIPQLGETTPVRDTFELALLPMAMERKMPVLGICRGIQVMNVALGGTLYQDIPSQLNTQMVHKQTQERFEPSHSVNVIENTPLSDMTGGKTTMMANSFHHQAIKELGRGLAVMARADDGIIEAVYMPEKKHVRAYQWHPERLWQIDADNLAIFTEFVKACSHS